jgi:hypothetical protein
MKCALCDKEIEPEEKAIIRIGVVYHAVVQQCMTKKKKEEI